MSSVPANNPRRTPRRVPLLYRSDDPRFGVSAYAPRKLTLAEMQRGVSATTSNKVRALDPGASANRHELTTSDNPVFPPEERRADEGILWTFSSTATRARATGRSHRKILRFPALRPAYAKNRYDLEGNLARRGSSYKGDIWRYLATWGFRTLNDLDGAGFAPPSHDDLAAMFERRVHERAKTFDTYYSNRGHGISDSDVEEMADAAAAAVLRDWTPDWIREQRERGRRGGKISKRAPKWDDDDLDALSNLEGQTVAQQAAHLGVSPSTVDRMRRALRTR